MKILITNQKGGVGKSTIAYNLAGYIATRKMKKVSFIDFDKQGSSYNHLNRSPNPNIIANHVPLTYKDHHGLTLLDAKSRVRSLSPLGEVLVADLTWTHGLPYKFILDFDVLIVPSSNSLVEVASTEIFVLEYCAAMLPEIKRRGQKILIAPSRVDINQLSEISFAGVSCLDFCSIAPPLYRISQINSPKLENFWFQIFDNPIVSENWLEFCDWTWSQVIVESDLPEDCFNSPVRDARLPANAYRSRMAEFIPSFLVKKD